jgi:hypothetical protein
MHNTLNADLGLPQAEEQPRCVKPSFSGSRALIHHDLHLKLPPPDPEVTSRW